MTTAARPVGEARLSRAAAAAMRAAIRLAGGHEVCFVCAVDAEGMVETARPVARGDVRQVLALPGVAERGELLVHNHPSGVLTPSEPDLAVAARLHEDGVGFAIVDNDATRLYVVTEVPSPLDVEPVATDDVEALLGPDGPIAAAMREAKAAGAKAAGTARAASAGRRYEDRPAQRAMAAAVTEAFNGDGIALLEAGTGVGKSLGYLVPALRWSARNGERTIVSTATITLQEQLVGKDLPFLERAIDDQPVRFALLKGWRNYLCKQRLVQAQAADTSLFEAPQREELARIANWAQQTGDGSLADLPTPPRPDVWDEVSAESDLCPRLKCPHYDGCFLFAARQAAAQADVIVVNHHLLLADVAVRRASQNWEEAAVLPAYRRLIVDEGHHLEDAAAGHLGQSVTRRGVQRLLARLERKGGKGLLPTLETKLAQRGDLESVASLDLVRERLLPQARAARGHAERAFAILQRVIERDGGGQRRLDDDFARDPAWAEGLDVELTDTLGEITLVGEGLRTVRERLERDEAAAEELAPTINELRAVARRLAAAGDALGAALRPPPGGEPVVRWLECTGKPAPGGDRNVAVHAVPLDLAPILREDLFGRTKTAVLTSATLATDGGFDFLARRLGLADPPREVATAQFPSPFDYASQALLVVPTDTPAPNLDAAGHARAVQGQLRALCEASDGGVFGLFTSHRDLRATAEWWRAEGLGARWPLLVHGEESRDTLLARFRSAGRAVLLGTNTFWEGVDVAGEALRGLLIAKLPFKVPTEPLTAAHCEAIEADGGSPFAEYMLPHAALRLKQGFGRLVRTATDRGVVVLADSRLASKPYGRRLLAALPPARRVVGPWREARQEIVRFYASGG